MTIGVDLSQDEVTQICLLTNLDDSAEAIRVAAQEFLRLSRLRELKSVSGKVDFDESWQEFERIEVSETDFPQ